MTTAATIRLRWIRDQLDHSARELAATVERLPPDWRDAVGHDLERLVADTQQLTRSVSNALAARGGTRTHEGGGRDGTA